jgi:hypothetical protein
MSNDRVLEDVQSWLNQHGYVLEMEVARQLIPHCSDVAQGEQYIDPVTGKLRETDIFCSWGDRERLKKGTSHSLYLVIECKNTNAPWVAFFGGSEGSGGVFPYLIDGEWVNCARCDEIDQPLAGLGPGGNAPNAYSITEKRSDKSSRDHAREAVLAVTSASIAAVHDAEQYRKSNLVHYSLRVFPIVVTKSPLVACSLNDSGDVILSHMNSCWVSNVHEKWDNQVQVMVITAEAFSGFIARFATYRSSVGLA